MFRFILVTILALGFSGLSKANADPVQDTISEQIEAFKADDFATAFSFASPLIQGMFGTADRFGLMVRNGYPMVWRPDDVQFIGQEERGGLTYQKVMIRDQKGVFHTLEYEMIPTADGWQINGVQMIAAPEVQ